MTLDVADVLRDRMHEPAGLSRMAMISATVHVLAVAALILAPEQWLGRRNNEAPREVMTISLGGSEGPSNGGMTAAGGRPVQTETPADPKRPEAVRPPAAKAPEMVLPTPNAARGRAAPAPPVKQAPDEARGRIPTRGAQIVEGSAVAQTPARGSGFGLSTGGGAGVGATLDVADFCCPDYIVLMAERIRAAWDQKQGAAGTVIVRFTIQRDGRLTDPTVERQSGNPALDLAALRAIVVTKQLTPLPAAFPNPSLTIHLNFEYQR